jgi:hypothetical protein
MKTGTLEKLITLEIDETSIEPDSYLPYTTDIPQDCYIISIAARLDIAGRYYAGKMLQACTSYLLELLEQGIIIKNVYTVATTEDGTRIAQHLNFTPLATETEWKSKYESFRRPYILNLEDKESKSNFVKEYQRRLTNRSRRKKRYTKEDSKKP